MKTCLFLIFVLVCFANKAVSQKQDEKTLTTVFTEWNQSTIASADIQSKRALYPEWRLQFKQWSQIAEEILYSPTADDRDEFGKGEPDRIKFLKAIHIDTLGNKHFFIIETADGEGRWNANFLIEDTKNGSHVVVFAYFKNHWKCMCDTVIAKVHLHSRVKNYKKHYCQDGFNSDPLTLTEFNSLKIQSRYYIRRSIPENDDILRITGR